MKVHQTTCLPCLTTSPITSASLLETSISKILFSDIMPLVPGSCCVEVLKARLPATTDVTASHKTRDTLICQVGLPLMQVCSDQNAASTWREEGGFPAFSPSSAAHTVVGGAAFVLGGWDLKHKVEMLDKYTLYHEGASCCGELIMMTVVMMMMMLIMMTMTMMAICNVTLYHEGSSCHGVLVSKPEPVSFRVEKGSG